MNLYEVAKTEDIPAGTMKAVTVVGKEIIVFNVGGKFYALPRKCTHLSGDLSQGKLEGNSIICPRHGAHFDVTTGKCIQGPKIGPLKMNGKDEIPYVVRVDGNSIKVSV